MATANIARELCEAAISDGKMQADYAPVLLRGLRGGKIRQARDTSLYMAINAANRCMGEEGIDAISATVIGVAAEMILEHYK